MTRKTRTFRFSAIPKLTRPHVAVLSTLLLGNTTSLARTSMQRCQQLSNVVQIISAAHTTKFATSVLTATRLSSIVPSSSDLATRCGSTSPIPCTILSPTMCLETLLMRCLDEGIHGVQSSILSMAKMAQPSQNPINI